MSKLAIDVARRCLCLELLWQRYAFEIDAEEPVAERERGRAMWLSREGDLGITAALLAEERALLERPVSQLSEDDLDDLHGRAMGAAVLLWTLGRLTVRPTITDAESVAAESGLLGDGSIAAARAASEAATLRPEAELDDALAAYLHVRGKAREPEEAEKIFAGMAAHHLTWVLTPTMSFDDDIEP
jgi:hypothetical protein